MKYLLMLMSCVALFACETTVGVAKNTELPNTIGSYSSGYSYIPLDGLAVDQTDEGDSCRELIGKPITKPLLEALPDITVRYAIASLSADGSFSFGPSKITAKNNQYRAILDYVNTDAVPQLFSIIAYKKDPLSGTIIPTKLSQTAENEIVSYNVTTISNDSKLSAENEKYGETISFPIYVGIGLRMSADLHALKSGISLGSFTGIGLEAQAENLSGTLTVQTIGVTGQSISTALPLPSKLDPTTIGNGIMSIGAIRATIYNEAIKTPRVVGLYSPVGSNSALINAIYSELSINRVKWHRPCTST